MSHIVIIGGSPSATTKSYAVLNYAQHLLRRKGIHTSTLQVRNLPAEDLIFARQNSPAIRAAQCLLEQAEGVIIATPIYKAAYSGLLKAFLDLLPCNALQDKTVLPMATGGSARQQLALDYALNPVLASLGTSHILHGVYVSDSQIQFEHGGALRLEDDVEQRLRDSLDELTKTVQSPFAFEPKEHFDWSAGVSGKERPAYSAAPTLLEGFER